MVEVGVRLGVGVNVGSGVNVSVGVKVIVGVFSEVSVAGMAVAVSVAGGTVADRSLTCAGPLRQAADDKTSTNAKMPTRLLTAMCLVCVFRLPIDSL
jgi:hypothetical protein